VGPLNGQASWGCRSDPPEHGKQTNQGIGFFLECRKIRAGELGPPLGGVRI
jgi:hypothetical protein